MICAAVFDTDEKKRERLREWIVEYLIQADRELELLWFTDTSAEEKLDKYAGRMQMAMISLDEETGLRVGMMLYRRNPECRICYYRMEPCDPGPLFPSRPICFYLWKQGKQTFHAKLSAMMDEIGTARDIFQYETKRGMYLIPLRDILYAQSDLKYVQIHRLSGGDVRIFSRLSQIEERLNDQFIRIHKSFIVNRAHVTLIDKKEHTVRLSNGELLPISDAQYERALQKLRASGAEEPET